MRTGTKISKIILETETDNQYRAMKKNQHSVELIDVYRDSSLDNNPFTQTVVLRHDDHLLNNVNIFI